MDSQPFSFVRVLLFARSMSNISQFDASEEAILTNDNLSYDNDVLVVERDFAVDVGNYRDSCKDYVAWSD